MADSPSPDEIADVARRLRTALEIQSLLREEPFASPGRVLGPLRAAGKRGAALRRASAAAPEP